MSPRVSVVGIGADGWAGLGQTARSLVAAAEVLLGSARQLDYVPAEIRAQRVPWPSPMRPAVPALVAEHSGRRLCVLASGDPMFYGVGATLVDLLSPAGVQIVPHHSSASLACARLGWPAQDVEVLSAVARPLERVRALVSPGRRILVLSSGTDTPAALAALLTEAGYGGSRLAVLSQLGGPEERMHAGRAEAWESPSVDALNLVAVVCEAGPKAALLGRGAGLPDEAYDSDGQLTKREVRAVTLARLVPMPGQLLWDVGGGAGSIGIEWMRADRSARAIAIEERPDRAERIATNATALGVPDLRVVTGPAPGALADLPAPDAVFVGGGAGDDGVLDACWAALGPGGRLVVNAVTLETEAVLVARAAEFGGDLVRLAVSRAIPIGRYTGWRAQHPVTQWAVTK